MIPRDLSPWSNDGLPDWLWGVVILTAIAVTALIAWTLASGAHLPPVPGGRP